MASHDSLIVDQFALIDNPLIPENIPEISDAVFEGFREEQIQTDHTFTPVIPPMNSHEGFIDISSTPAAQLLDRIYFFPIDANLEHRFDLGLITSDVESFFQIWNAYRAGSKGVTLITSSNPSGTILNTPATPFSLNGYEEDEYSVTVTKIGVPNQETSYFFTIDGHIFELEITAERLQELDKALEPNWKRPTSFEFEYETVIWRNKRTNEQRRPFFIEPKRRQTVFFTFNEDDFENAHNVLKRSHAQTFFIPVFHEVMIPTNPTLNGETIIDIEENITNYWNLRQYTNRIQIQDVYDPTNTEILAISSLNLGNNQIIVTSPITGTYKTDKNNTMVFPVMIANILSFKPQYVNDKVVEFELIFEELRKGS